MQSLNDLDQRVEHAYGLCMQKLNGMKACPDAEEWSSYLEEQIQPTINLGEQDVKDAARRLASIKARNKKAEKSEKSVNGEANEGQDDVDDDDDDEEESG